ncbi:MAG: bifunctional tetrahydrofolate synthase/dihydrofolate synthase [Pseudomonadota bacterium]
MGSELSDWLARLERAHPSAVELGLERVARVRDAMGLQPDFPVILVGGTNGKGSACAYLEAILRAQGFKTGLYTSPHLLRYNERVRIDGVEASDADIAAGLQAVEEARGGVSLTYFEHGTLGAVWQFVRAGVEVAILEVGLGGRLDAVNVFEPAVSVVTTVDLDHQGWLGDSREAIGFEKAGIFRPGKPAVCGDADPPQSLLDHARAIGAKLLRSGRDFVFAGDDGTWRFRLGECELTGLPLPALPGGFQLGNAAAALAALSAAADILPVSPAAISRGLSGARLPGRFQRLAGPVEVVLDVAHNPQSARALADNLGSDPAKGKSWAVFAMLADKDADGVIAALAGCFDAWFVAGLGGGRGRSGESLAARVRAQSDAPTEAFADPLAAFRAAKLRAGESDRITVFGSFYTVAEILNAYSDVSPSS